MNTQKILRPVNIMLLFGVIGLISACQSLPQIHALYDQTADLNRYATFAFYPQLQPDGEEYDKLSTRYIKAAIMTQMTNKGYRYSNNPDLWVNFNTYTKQKIQAFSDSGHHPYYDFRHDYGVWGGYPHHETRIEQYTEGTLNIDVIDKSNKKLLWEGIAVGRLSKKMLDNLEVKINQAVALIFERFPS
ncbi:MAG: hypothetical protein ACI95X_002502 [Paraglaciecola sp.]|jgi:hypothetical protein